VLETVLVRATACRGDIAAWIMHAGGRDVLLALENALRARDRQAFRYSAAMLREYGNLSSAFVYFVLAAALADEAPGGWWWLSSVRRRLQLPRRLAEGRLTCCRAFSSRRRSTISPPTTRRRSAPRRDLRRVNAFMGARRILERALERALAATDETVGGVGRRLRILEIGCGDGRLMLEVRPAPRARWPEVELDLLDRQPIVDPETIAAYAAARLAGAAADRRRARLGRRSRLDRALGPGRHQPLPASLRRATDCGACSPAAPAAPMRSPPASRGAAASRSAPRT
jgi:hypothetical protein